MKVATWVAALVGVLLAALPAALIWLLRAYLRSERARRAEAAGRVAAERSADELRDGWQREREQTEAVREADRVEDERIEAVREEAHGVIERVADRSLEEVARWWDVVRGRG